MIYYEAKDFPIDGLEATGEDVKVHVPKGAKMRSYKMFGHKNGSITVLGDGDGSAHHYGSGNGDAWRVGDGLGNAYRDGDGDGHAHRDGDGYGSAYRDGTGEGGAYRWGAGNGGAYRDHNGVGNAFRDGDGDGNAWRDGEGYGNAYRAGTGSGDAYRWGAGAGIACRHGSGGGYAYRDGEIEEDRMTEHDYDNGYRAGMQKMRDLAQARIDFEIEENSDVDGDEIEYIRVDVHEARIKRLEDKISHLEEMRPFWAKGYSSDSMAAQTATGALSSIWRCLGVKDQTACMYALKELKKTKEIADD